MRVSVSNFLFALCSVLLAVGGTMHGAAFAKASRVLGPSALPRFYRGSAEALWLADSATLIILAFAFGILAIRPSAAGKPIAFVLALIPGSTAILLYYFLGSFFAGHLLLMVAILASVAAFCVPAQVDASKKHHALATVGGR